MGLLGCWRPCHRVFVAVVVLVVVLVVVVVVREEQVPDLIYCSRSSDTFRSRWGVCDFLRPGL